MQSEYNDKELTKPQLLAERMCQRMAKKQKLPLTYRFWQNAEWKKIYQWQVVKASMLLKEYAFEEIIRALANPRAAFIYSFGSKSLWKPYLESARKMIATERSSAITMVVDESSISAKPVAKPARKNLLMELD